MKTRILAALLGLAAFTSARATLYSYDFTGGFNNGGVIPDANVTGWSDTRSLSLSGTEINDVNVRLNISGGWNGDLYGYLVHSSGFAVLLNRPGRTSTDLFGYADAGFNITLDDSAATDIHLYGGNGGSQLSGLFKPDARTANPATVVSTDSRTAVLGNFNGLSADGGWTLFLADFAVGDQSTLVSWGLDISVVPEPTTWALVIFGVAAVLFAGFRWCRALNLSVR